MIKITKSKLLGFFAILMLVLNLGLMAFIFTNKGNHPPDEGPQRIVVERLGFNNEQTKEYDQLIEAHQKDIIEIEEDILLVKADLYRNLGENKSKADSLMLVLGDLQTAVEQVHYNHFEDIKAICSEEQLPKFEALREDLADLFMKRIGPPKK